MSKTWISSDWHLSHSNILKYCPESRGHFSSVEEMNEAIISNINSVISKEDTLIIVGDIGFTSAGKVCEYLKRVNGKKKLVWGNHDKKFRQTTEYDTQKEKMGVIWDGDYLEFDHRVQDKKYSIVAMHYPIWSFNRQHHGAMHFHGHCHSPKDRRDTFGPTKRVRDIGLDGNDMMPYDMDALCVEMSKRDFKFEGHHDGTRS